ncbi:unnamed protein product [Closterium sp. Naga37s-1]|nr:unnamed protein product [Closterium sp. Naga37s-1]
MALDAARLIQQVGMQQLMRRRQSPRRASAPEQLPDPQPSTWAYSRPVVILDAFWNLAFVVVTAITLFISQARNERPPAPLSIWLLGYAVQCAVHVICVLLEHERRESRRPGTTRRVSQHNVLLCLVARAHFLSCSLLLALMPPSLLLTLSPYCSLARRVESANTMFSFAWWLVGFTWILSTIDDSFKDAPILSWATTAFLAFDVFFVVFCVAVACVVGMAVCCCLPCIIALIYAVADQASAVSSDPVILVPHCSFQEGATREQIEALPKFKFYRHRTAANNSSQASSICPFHSCSSSFRLSSSPPLSSSTSFSSSPATRTAPCPCCSSSAFAGAMWRNAVGLAAGLWRRAGRAGGNNSSIRNSPSGDGLDVRVTVEEETGGVMSLVGSAHPPRQRHVEAEDAECCVCLVRYEDGCVLRELPCSHHFHAACIDKWLKSHPTCPLCKRDITKGVGSMPSPDTLPSSLSAGASAGGALESTPGPSGTP